VERFFLNPWALALGALSGVIVLLYILKLRRAKVRVGSTLLWEKTVHDTKANAPWQKLRFNWLMLLQILALLLLALALARPFVFGTALRGGRSVLVIDTSASMLASDVSPTRLDRALGEASKVVSDMKPGDEAMVIAAGPDPLILSGFSRDKSELQRALRKAKDKPGGEANIDSALRLASSVASGGKARAVVFSDGAVGDLDPFATGDLKIDFFPVGRASENAAIIGAGARRDPFDDKYEVFVALHSFFGTVQNADLTISAAGQTLDVRSVELKPGGRNEISLPGLPYIADPIKVELGIKDALVEDNVAYIVMPKQVRYTVALASTSESVLLRKVLGSQKDVDFFDLAAGSKPSGNVNVYIVEGDAPVPADPTARYLFIDTTTSAAPFLPVVPGDIATLNYNSDPPVIPSVVAMQRSHPLLRYVNIGDLKLAAMRRCQLQPWGRVVVDASEGPLIVEGSQDGQRTVYLAFDIYRSDFPLRAAFPIFMANAIHYLGEASSGAVGRTVPAGERVDLLAPLRAEHAVVTDPAGVKSTLDLGTRDFTLTSSRTGVYSVS